MEKSFLLMYYIPGMTDLGLEKMERRERDWYYERLKKQKEVIEKPKK